MTTKDKKFHLYRVMAKYHGYLGLAFGILIISAGITGIFLNHEDFFLELFESESAEEQAATKEPKAESVLKTGGLPETKVTFAEALSIAFEVFGENVPLDKIELKDEKGLLIYKVVTNDKFVKKQELIVNANTGEATYRDKDAYAVNKVNAGGTTELAGIDWGDLINDIHTGEISGGLWGQLLIDLGALIMIFLTGSGIYVWCKPRLKRRRKHKAQISTGTSASTVIGKSFPVGGLERPEQ